MSLTRRAPTGQTGSNQESTVEYQNLSLGEHEGRLVYVADLGLQAKEFAGEFKGNFQQFALGIEFVGKTFKINDEEKPVMLWTKPFYVYTEMTEKGKELEYFSVFNPQAEAGQVADWDSVLGMPCSVVNGHTPDKTDPNKKYDNIVRLQAIPAKYQDGVEAAKITPASGDGEEVVDALYGLAKWVYDRQVSVDEASREYAEQEASAAPSKSSLSDDFDDSIPF